MFTEFERWSLSIAVPALNLPALENPTDADLHQRAYDIAYDLTPADEKDLASSLILLGALKFIERNFYEHQTC